MKADENVTEGNITDESDAAGHGRHGSGTVRKGKRLCTNQEEMDSNQNEFVKMINKSIRRAFRRLAVVVLAISVAIGAFVQFCLPDLVSGFYYDPTKQVGEGWNQMSIDMAVYTEMFLPANKRLFVNSSAKGYGKYDITVAQSVSYTGEFTNVSGEVTRGKLKYYDENILREPTGNCFSWFQAEGWSEGKRLSEVLDEEEYTCAAGNRERSIETLKNLDEREYYMAYVSLDRIMDYTSVKKLLDEQGIGSLWYAAKISAWIGGITLQMSDLNIRHISEAVPWNGIMKNIRISLRK